MLYEIEQAVFERFPGYARMVVVAEGVDNTREIPELAELLAQCEEGVRRDDLEDLWHVRCWKHGPRPSQAWASNPRRTRRP